MKSFYCNRRRSPLFSTLALSLLIIVVIAADVAQAQQQDLASAILEGVQRFWPPPPPQQQQQQQQQQLEHSATSAMFGRATRTSESASPIEPFNLGNNALTQLAGRMLNNVFGISITTTTPRPSLADFLSPQFYGQILQESKPVDNSLAYSHDDVGTKSAEPVGQSGKKSNNVRRAPSIQPVATAAPIVSDWERLWRNAKNVDLGGGNFDRLVVQEKVGTNNAIADSFFGKWNRKGLQWTNGNLRLVNVIGNDVFGNELVTKDQSVDIPIQAWLDMASQALRAQPQQNAWRRWKKRR